jgi:hypothetical protein
VLHAYEAASWVIAAIAFAGGAIGLALLARPRARGATTPAVAFATGVASGHEPDTR